MPNRYDPVARVLHWLTVLMLLGLFAVGIWITAFEPKDEAFKLRLYMMHESSGVTLLALTLFRLFWRWRHPPPSLPADLPPLLRAAAHANHAAVYLLLLVMPVLGFLATNAWGFPLRWYGLIALPSPVGHNEALAETLSALHYWCALALAALLLVHIAAAFWHYLIRKDQVLQRML